MLGYFIAAFLILTAISLIGAATAWIARKIGIKIGGDDV